MLADVVAKRTRCDGPVSTLSPTIASSSIASSVASTAATSLHDGESGLGDVSSPRLEMVPQSTSVCAVDAGQRKRLTVERGAVNEALEILDRAVGRGGPLRR